MAKHAAMTIISKSCFSFAKVLAESYKKHHPQNDFLIVLADRAEGYIPKTLACGAEVLDLTELQVPDLARFIYRHTAEELSTAVKPFALADLFRRRDYETMLVLDPDIRIYQPLTEVYSAFDSASIVLIPHMRKPFYDNAQPGDIHILQSGTYNLGFLGLKGGDSSRRMIEWWMTKLYRDDIVHVPEGLFLTQKWLDLVPGFFPDHKIIHHPAYNVAYWNLHERRLTGGNGEWKVDGGPLVFFHFSGYTPTAPQTLSKYQNRHELDRWPELKALTNAYAGELLAGGYEETSSWPYAFETLSNGVRLPLTVVRDAMQWASREGILTPDPLSDPDGFCRFLMRRGVVPHKPKCVLLCHFLLQRRPDIAAEFPGGLDDSSDKGFRQWLSSQGSAEENLSDLLKFERTDEIIDYVADAFYLLRNSNRFDVLTAYKDMWTDDAVFDKFANWFTAHGIAELGLTADHSRRIRGAKSGIAQILNIYFLRGDLQAAFPVLWEPSQRQRFVNWLRRNQSAFGLTAEEISLFGEFAGARRELIEKMRFLYQHCGRQRSTSPNIYAIEDKLNGNPMLLEPARFREWLASEELITPADHYVAQFGDDRESLSDFNKCSVPGLSPRENLAFVNAVRDALDNPPPSPVVNFAGFLSAPSGIGESARSMLSTLSYTDVEVHPMTLPHRRALSVGLPTSPVLFGWPSTRAQVSITVANADSIGLIENFLPRVYWAVKNAAYWVWETEELPPTLRQYEQFFDEIWSPSNHSAEGIRRTVSKPVKVLPHTLDFALIDQAARDRSRFGLPETGILFGFIFDPQSVLERKNLTGLVRTFRKAFRDDDNCYLVLKVNGRCAGAYDYEMVKAQADWSRILFVEETYSRQDTYDFMKSLDVYVSLHRSEGFGLTCAEAMALGLPVVASKYSGNLDYMRDDNSLLVPTKVIETDRPYGAYPAGTRWGDPDVDVAATMLRSLIDQDRRVDIGARGAESVRRTLSQEAVSTLAQSMIHALVV